MTTLAKELVGIACIPEDCLKSNTRPLYASVPVVVENWLRLNGCLIVDRNQLGKKRRLRYQVIDGHQNVLLLTGHINKAWSFACEYTRRK